MRSRREQWVERVEGWRRSGLSAKRFAESIGVSAGTLTHWAWRLGRESRRQLTRRAPRVVEAPSPAMIEIVSAGSAAASRFEVHLISGHRVHVPAAFDTTALKRLVAVLEDKA